MTDDRPEIELRRSEIADLSNFFQLQLDKEASYLSAFTTMAAATKTEYFHKYTKLLNDSTVNSQTILIDNVIVGSIAKFEREDEAEISHLIDRHCWGQGIATTALRQFLTIETARPLFGRVAFDNFASQKVLEKCGFIKIGTGKFFANFRQT